MDEDNRSTSSWTDDAQLSTTNQLTFEYDCLQLFFQNLRPLHMSFACKIDFPCELTSHIKISNVNC